MFKAAAGGAEIEVDFVPQLPALIYKPTLYDISGVCLGEYGNMSSKTCHESRIKNDFVDKTEQKGDR